MSSSKTEKIQISLNDDWMVTAECFSDFVLLRVDDDNGPVLRSMTRAIVSAKFDFVVEVICTEVEICLAVNDDFSVERLRELGKLNLFKGQDRSADTHVLSICFDEEHDDWDEIARHTGLSKESYIDRLLNSELHVAMTGFLPGFVYLGGLPEELRVPRKATPSSRTRPGMFAIGGKYAGIYSLPSAAGWNCIGEIEQQVFDETKLPPVSMEVGDLVRLKQVDQIASSDGRRVIRNSQSLVAGDKRFGSLFFESSGLLTLIQDKGRAGFARYAIPRSGAMDFRAAEMGNAILGNADGCPVIECHFVAPRIRFESAATICLTGADMQWCVAGDAVERNRTIDVRAGGVLSGRSAVDGCRSYISIYGEIESSSTLGSAATYLPAKFGGNGGAALSAGDMIRWKLSNRPPFPLQLRIDSSDTGALVSFEAGPEFDWMGTASRRAILEAEFSVSSKSDRMGARLNGPELSTNGRNLADSVPLLPGMIQLTPQGQLIVVLQDGQTTGGYPRIGYLNADAVRRLNQTKIGHPFRFEMAD